MLQAAGRFGEQIEEEVAVVRQEPPHPAVLADDRLEILGGAHAVEDTCLAFVHEVVPLAVHLELVHRGIADQDR